MTTKANPYERVPFTEGHWLEQIICVHRKKLLHEKDSPVQMFQLVITPEDSEEGAEKKRKFFLELKKNKLICELLVKIEKTVSGITYYNRFLEYPKTRKFTWEGWKLFQKSGAFSKALVEGVENIKVEMANPSEIYSDIEMPLEMQEMIREKNHEFSMNPFVNQSLHSSTLLSSPDRLGLNRILRG